MEKKDRILVEISGEKLVEKIVHNIGGNADDDLQDLIQDLYIDLMNKPADLIVSLYNNNQLNFFITKMVLNNIRSKNSPWYSTYKKDKTKRVPITDNIADNEE